MNASRRAFRRAFRPALDGVRALDPRWYQITTLTALLVYGLTALSFEVTLAQTAVALGVAVTTQFACTKIWRLDKFDPKSALISALSLTLLLRASSLGWIALAAFVAIASKFVVRFRGKHVFNPTNGAIMALMAAGAPVWVSPGQWGNVAFFAFLMACLGGLVVMRSARADVAIAFLAFFAAGLVLRSLMVEEPMTIPLHRMQSGALLLFAFFMISDPKTTPDARAGRIVFAFLVAAVAWYIQFKMFATNGPLWGLFLLSVATPLIDLAFKGARYSWARVASVARPIAVVGVVALAIGGANAKAFCGFYVAKADSKLFNHASQVILVHDEDKTVMTMANEFEGKVKDFAMVVPVPTSITKEQVHIGDRAVVDHVDAYTVPRLVEYFDPDPCYEGCRNCDEKKGKMVEMEKAPEAKPAASRARALGVTIEESYTVGEYDILILSAKQSDGLITWLQEEGYRIPGGAEPVVKSYLDQKMHWFVAKVNLAEHDKMGGGKLRPIQVAYQSPKFMLPIRLGTVNAQGTQDLIVYAFTKNGRVEVANYKTVKLPTGENVPEYTKDVFGDFYKSMFGKLVDKNDMRAVVTEYAWNLSVSCDPCSADPIVPELKSIGVWWLPDVENYHAWAGGVGYVTRLHVRYDRDHFPEDLVFSQTYDKENFQGRYVIQHAFQGDLQCDAAAGYKKAVWDRQQKEATTLADLTGWNVDDIKNKMHLGDKAPAMPKWYERLWK